MITTQIEQAICLRLQRGLGRMVRTVKSYNGEADDLAAQIKTLPAVWVTYGGSRVETISGGNRYQDTATFAVMCATRSLRNEVAQRQGGVVLQEIGSNDLIDAVRRLLDGQRLGLPAADSRGLTPKAIRAIANHTLVQQAAVSVYALEYTLRLNRHALENDRFPEPQSDSTHPDYVFTRYQGETSAPYPPFEYLDGLIFDPQAENAKIPLTAQFWQD